MLGGVFTQPGDLVISPLPSENRSGKDLEKNPVWNSDAGLVSLLGHGSLK
jgi:hypothetical protein